MVAVSLCGSVYLLLPKGQFVSLKAKCERLKSSGIEIEIYIDI